jgi:hypothetical protein
LLSFATGALEQPNKFSGLVGVGGVKHSSSDNKWLLADRREYGLEADLAQAKDFSNLPSGTDELRRRYRAEGVAEDRAGRYFLAPSVAGGSNSWGGSQM